MKDPASQSVNVVFKERGILEVKPLTIPCLVLFFTGTHPRIQARYKYRVSQARALQRNSRVGTVRLARFRSRLLASNETSRNVGTGFNLTANVLTFQTNHSSLRRTATACIEFSQCTTDRWRSWEMTSASELGFVAAKRAADWCRVPPKSS